MVALFINGKYLNDSVEISTESRNHDKEGLFLHCDKYYIVGIWIPELASAHVDTLSGVLANNHLDDIFVPLVFFKGFERVLR